MNYYFFCTNAKVHEMTKMLYKRANNLFFQYHQRTEFSFHNSYGILELVPSTVMS
jgi:hypothetical protein